jgi:CheY-like chemotaxis protein
VARVLVIDDQDDVRQAIRDLLRPRHHVLEASSGAEGVCVFRQEQVDLVLCDLFMPGKDGLETLRELRRHSDRAKIIALGGGSFCGRIDLLGIVKLLGADQVLTKPFDRDTLLAVVGETLAENLSGPKAQGHAVAVKL